MEEDDIIFKVPSVKKRRPNLYCTETVDELDNVWNSPLPSPDLKDPSNPPSRLATKVNPETSGSHPRRVLFKLNNETTMSKDSKLPHNVQNISEMSICDIDFLTTTNADQDEIDFTDETSLTGEETENREGWFQTPRDKYTMGLWQELNRCTPHSLGNSEPSKPPLEVVEAISVSTANFNDRKNLLQSKNNELDLLSSWRSPDKDEHDAVFPYSPDVLIVRDESMANADSDSSGSDLDWESLTPPASRSPGDHTVPDFSDLSGVTHPSDMLLYPFDHLASLPPLGEFGMERAGEYSTGNTRPGSSLQHTVSSRSSFDQMVPECYI